MVLSGDCGFGTNRLLRRVGLLHSETHVFVVVGTDVQGVQHLGEDSGVPGSEDQGERCEGGTAWLE